MWRSSLRERTILVGIALIALVLVLLWGPGDAGSPDSAAYLDGARHLAAGDGYVSCRTALDSQRLGPITLWAPGFSALITPWIWLGMSPVGAARVVLTLGFVVAAVLSAALARASFGRRALWPPLVAASLFALQPSQLSVVNRVLSDTPFVPFMLGAVSVALALARTSRPALRWKIVLGALLAAAVLVRHAGLLIVPGILLGLFVSMRGPFSVRRRTLELLPVVATFTALYLPWMIRNSLLTAAPLGRLTLRVTNPWKHAVDAARGVFAWIPDAMESFGRFKFLGVLWVVPVLALLLLTAWAVARHRPWQSPTVRLLFCSIAGYVALMVLTAAVHPFNALSSVRFWAGVWPLTAALLFAVLRRVQRPVWLERAWIVALSATIALFGVAYLEALPKAHQPEGLLAPEFRQLARLMPKPGSCRLLMSDPRPVLIHRHLGLTSLLPRTVEDLHDALETPGPLCVAVLMNDLVGSRKHPPRVSRRVWDTLQTLTKSNVLTVRVRHEALRIYERRRPGGERSRRRRRVPTTDWE